MENKLEEANRSVIDYRRCMTRSRQWRLPSLAKMFMIRKWSPNSKFNLSIRKLTHELDDVKDKLKGAQEGFRRMGKDAELQSVVARLQAKNGTAMPPSKS